MHGLKSDPEVATGITESNFIVRDATSPRFLESESSPSPLFSSPIPDA